MFKRLFDFSQDTEYTYNKYAIEYIYFGLFYPFEIAQLQCQLMRYILFVKAYIANVRIGS